MPPPRRPGASFSGPPRDTARAMSQENVEVVTQVAVTAGPVQRVDVRAHTWMAAGFPGCHPGSGSMVSMWTKP